MSPPELDLAPGSVVAGRFRVEAPIGSGGHGHVVRATALDTGRSVALKILRPELVDSAEERGRFRREARVAQQLEHPNIVRLYELGETAEGLCFMAFELLAGEPLSALLAREAPLPAARTARIATQVLKSLMAAHDHGVIHRDVKPPNVFLCRYAGEQDFVKVLDFGVAKPLVSSGATEAGLTSEGELIGTPSYMAPEQVAGLAVGPSTDLYALGLVMAECLSGRVVFPATDLRQAVLAQLSSEPAPLDPSVLGSPLGPVIRRAVEKLPPARYQSAAEMLAALEVASGTAVPVSIAAEPAASTAGGMRPAVVATADTVLAPTPTPAGSWPGSSGISVVGPTPAPAGSWPGASASVQPAQASGSWPTAAPTLLGRQRPTGTGSVGTMRAIVALLLVLAAFGLAVALTLVLRSSRSSARGSADAGSEEEATESTSGAARGPPDRARGNPWDLDAAAITQRMSRLGWKRTVEASGPSGATGAMLTLQFQRPAAGSIRALVIYLGRFDTAETAELSLQTSRAGGDVCDRKGRTIACVRGAADRLEAQRVFDTLFK